MIGTIIFMIVILAELIYCTIRIWEKSTYWKEKSILHIVELILFLLLIMIGVLHWSFRWILLLGLLILRGIISAVSLIRKRESHNYKRWKTIVGFLGSFLIIFLATAPSLIFPQCNQLPVSGNYKIETEIYTWEDKNSTETFETDGSNREVTVQFWYPKTDKNETFPLIIFSHGAFGFRMSNYSTYAELASNGYVVCSIDHPYHAFFTKQADGKIITVNPEFMQSVFLVNEENTTEDQIYDITRKWMNVRCTDINFVIDTIKEKVSNQKENKTFSCINISEIGIIGHSLGGAAAVTVGRQRTDIDAVIDLDGTMLGEEIACDNNRYTINEEPYPVPLLCIDTTAHYQEGLTYGEQYANNVTLKNAIDAKEVHFNGAGHMNFTDLVFFSPMLANMLGSGEINKIDCIQTMNEVILNYYNHYLKQMEELDIEESYSF